MKRPDDNVLKKVLARWKKWPGVKESGKDCPYSCRSKDCGCPMKYTRSDACDPSVKIVSEVNDPRDDTDAALDLLHWFSTDPDINREDIYCNMEKDLPISGPAFRYAIVNLVYEVLCTVGPE